MNRNPKTQISELRLEEAPPVAPPSPAAPAAPPVAPPVEPPPEPTTIILPQFDAAECIDSAMESGETMGTMELGDGIQGITCKRSAEGPAEVQALAFDPSMFDEETAKAWAESNAFIAWSKRVAVRQMAMEMRTPRVHSAKFEDIIPGAPVDPETPRVAEGMETFRREVLKAIDERGWSYFVTMEPEYDFIVEELWSDRALVIDTMSGTYFSILVATNEDGTVTLGDPTPADITVSIKEGEAENVPVAAQAKTPVAGEIVALRRTGTLALVQKIDNLPKGSTPLYRVLLTSGGWTKDNRFLADEALREAVALGKFDGAKCFYGHPEEGSGGKRSRLAVGVVKPGSVILEDNRAGHVDVWGDIAIMRSTGAEIRELLDHSLEIGVPLLGTSVYCRETENHFGEIEGRQAQIFTRLISEKVNVDFVDDAAFPRAGVTAKLAAERAGTQTEGQLTMEERERLQKLEAENAELKAEKKAEKARSDRLALVDTELQLTGWPKEFVAIQRPILAEIEKGSTRKAHIATMTLLLGSTDPKVAGRRFGPTDQGSGGGSILSPNLRTELDAIAKARGWKVDAIANAEKTAFA